MCLTKRQYSANTYIAHFLWQSQILQKQMTEIMEELEEAVAEEKYTDGEYLAMSKNIKSEYDKAACIIDMLTFIQKKLETHIRGARMLSGNSLADVVASCEKVLKYKQGGNAGWMDDQDKFSDFLIATRGNELIEIAGGGNVEGDWGDIMNFLDRTLDVKLHNTQLYADRDVLPVSLELINIIGTGEESKLGHGYLWLEWGKTPEAGAAGSSWENPRRD